jgi:hypothetical protein
MTKKLLILLGCVCLGGCVPHFKEMDSYHTSFHDTYSHPDSVTPPPEKGDPYAFGGIAEGSGGTMARQSYATDNDTPDFRDATGTGTMGEISKDRTHTPGGYPGETGTLPGAAHSGSTEQDKAPATGDPTVPAPTHQ